MKTEDYLWDKTGEDPEIEKLENALAVFRYKETAAPEMPAKVLPFAQKTETPPRSFFRFAYAAAACIAFAAIALGIWFQISNSKIEVAQSPLETIAPAIEKEVSEVAPVKDSGELKVETRKQIAPRKTVKIKKPVDKTATIARNTKVKYSTVELTREEKYAYNQLMLALSITSSKLKLVSDKIENSENEKGQ